jgi:hypothetical protein
MCRVNYYHKLMHGKKRVRAMSSKKKSKGLKKFPKEITIGCDVGNQYYSSEPTTWV